MITTTNTTVLDCRLDCTDPKSVPHQPPPTPADALKTAPMPLTSPEQGGALSKRLKDGPSLTATATNSWATGLHEKEVTQATGADCILDGTDLETETEGTVQS